VLTSQGSLVQSQYRPPSEHTESRYRGCGARLEDECIEAHDHLPEADERLPFVLTVHTRCRGQLPLDIGEAFVE